MHRFLAAVLLFSLVGGLRGSAIFHQPLLGAGTGGDPGQEVSFDAGLVDSCEVPSTCICGVDYEVPSSVAKIAAAIEREIDGTYGEVFELLHSATCRNMTKRVVCAQRFPRCVTNSDGTKQVELTSLQCEEELRTHCPESTDRDTLIRNTCGVEDSTQDIGECKSVAQYAADSQESSFFQQCTLSDQWQVTEWMYQYLKYYELTARASTEDSDQSPICLRGLANLTCQSIGRCSASGDRVELINTRQFCEQTINCFPDVMADQLRDRYDCELWPEAITDVPTATIHTDTSDTTDTTSTTDTNSKPTSPWPTLDTATSPINSSITPTALSLWTLTLTAFTAVILHHL